MTKDGAPGPLFHPRPFCVSLWPANDTTNHPSAPSTDDDDPKVRARRHLPPTPPARQLPPYEIRLVAKPSAYKHSSSPRSSLSCPFSSHTSQQHQHPIHTSHNINHPSLPSLSTLHTHTSSPLQTTNTNPHTTTTTTTKTTKTTMSSRDSYSTSMSPSPPADIGSYSRYMAQHTKRQMEAASTSSPRRSPQGSGSSAGGGPSAMPNGVSSSARGQHSTSLDFGHQS